MGSDKRKIQSTVEAIISFLHEKGMGDLVPEIGMELVQKGNSSQEKVYVYTAFKIDGGQIDKVQKLVAKRIGGGKKEYEFIVEPKIIDGLVVSYKDKRWDMSLVSQIHKIKETI